MSKRKPKLRWWVAADNITVPCERGIKLFVGRPELVCDRQWLPRAGSLYCGYMVNCHGLRLRPGQCIEIEPPKFVRKRVRK